jgi:hypothetical protein
LEAEHPHARREARRAVAEVAERIRSETLDKSPDYAATRTFIEALHRSGQLDDGKLQAIAEIGRLEEIATALALMGNLSPSRVERALRQDRVETILIIAKAIGLSWSTVKAILSVRAAGRSTPADELAQCLASFERLNAGTAREIVDFYRRREQPEPGQPT